MASNRIKGITIEIGGDTTGLDKSLAGVNKEIQSTQSQLKDVERLLKLDPGNVQLLQQKQKLLTEAVSETKQKLDALKSANEQVTASAKNYDAWKEKYDPIKAKIDETGKKLDELKKQAAEANEKLEAGEISQDQYDSIQKEIQDTSSELKTLKQNAKDVSDEFGNPVSPEQYDAMQREIAETESKLKSLEDQAADSNAVLSQIGLIGDKFQAAGEKIEAVGKKLLPVTGMILGLGGTAIKVTSDFDTGMSQVAAVSGATGEELDQLRAKAREMGSQTKFSASEAAEAMNYMAMAGWKTEDMLSGIEGIMDLAAASGENLGTTSDIVTDALTAFGLTAADSAHFADILAAASSNANTNVSMMGETFKYVAPLAGAMGYSAEDVAVAIGLMANSGIKASQAGTQLRSSVSNMVKPTDAMVDVMDLLGISITDADGNVKSLHDTMDMLRQTFRSYTEEEREQGYAAADAYYRAAEGAEEYVAEQENLTEAEKKQYLQYLKGKDAIDQLTEAEKKSRLETLFGIKLKEKEKITDEQYYQLCTTTGRQALEGLTAAEQSKYASTLFGKEAMSGMLAIINASDSDYKKLTKSIKDCSGTTKKMADTMQDNLSGQVTILKSQLEELAISIGEELMPFIRDIVSVIQEWVDKLNAMEPSQKRMIITIAGVVAAIGPLLIIIGKVSTGIGAIMSLVSSLGGMLGALGAAGGPILLVVASLTAMAAAMAIATGNTEEYYEEARKLTEQEEEHKEKVNELHEAYTAMDQARDQAVAASEVESQKNHLLLDELRSITDENGNVKAGYEERAQVITGQLAEALGTEIEMTDNQIQNYQEICAQLDTLIQKKQANAVLEANEAAYAEALTGQAEAYMAYNDAKTDVENTTKALSEAQAAEEEARQKVNAELERTAQLGLEENAVLLSASKQYEAAKETVRGLTEKLSGMNDTLAQAEEAFVGYNTTIENYEGLASAVISDDQEKISDALLKTLHEFETTETGTKESLERQAENFRQQYEAMKKAVEEGAPGVRQAQVDEMAELVRLSEQELAKLPESSKTAGGDAATGFAGGIAEGTRAATEAAKKIAADTLEEMKTELDSHSPSKKTDAIGRDFDAGYAGGITSDIPKGVSAVAALVAQSTAEMKNLPAMGRQWGSDFVGGFISSVNSRMPELRSMCADMANTVSQYMHFSRPDVGPLRDYESWMPDFIDGLAAGIDQNLWRLEAPTSRMAQMLQMLQQNAAQEPDLSGIEGVLNTWLPRLGDSPETPAYYVVMDTGALVGQLVPGIDRELGRLQTAASRGG